jgi:cellobiose-specific phosphotransferase system component IIA
VTAQEIEDLIQNTGASDEEVLRAIKEYTADKYDDAGGLLPLSQDEIETSDRLRTLTLKLRPKVMEKFQEEFMKEHAENCPACQALKGSS